jgi:hypothetical protein
MMVYANWETAKELGNLLSVYPFSRPRNPFEKTGLPDINFSKPDFQISRSEFRASEVPIFSSS